MLLYQQEEVNSTRFVTTANARYLSLIGSLGLAMLPLAEETGLYV